MLLLALAMLTLVFAAIIAHDLRSAASVPILEPASTPLHEIPSLTVIIPARNEAARIGRCLAGLVAQELPDLHVLVLDDNSTDGTSAVAAAFRDRLPRLEIVQGQPLPPGWAGKCWACWQAAQATTADWLLFLDADTAPQQGMIATLLPYAITQRIAMLTLLPLLELHSFWERVLMPPFIGIIQATFPIDRVNDQRSPLALANGQCILVQRSVYCAVDGHRAVRDSVLEDVRLAQTIKQAGYALRAVGGPALMQVRMYTNFGEVAEGLRKNAVAGIRAGGSWRTAWGGARQALLAFAPATLIALGLGMSAIGNTQGALIASFGGGLLLLTLGYWGFVVRRLNHLHPAWALLYPFGTLCYFMLAGLSLLNVVTGRGVTWKGRTYRG